MDGKNILIIEDDAILADLMRERFVAAGFEVDVAEDGEKGLEAAKKKPDLIMLDIMLPKMDGFTVMKTIREGSDWGAHVPVVIASNLSPDNGKVIDIIAAFSPAFYFVKADNPLSAIVEKVKDLLAPK